MFVVFSALAAGCAAAVFCGAAAQRVTGIGFNLLAAPALVVLLGPHNGVLISCSLSVVLNIVVLSTVWSHVRWPSVATLLGSAIAITPLGLWTSQVSSVGTLTLMCGLYCVVGVALIALSGAAPLFGGRKGALLAGTAAGFFNITVAIGGPAFALHALSEHWKREQIVATGQVVFLILNITAVASRGELPNIGAPEWALLLLPLGGGILLGRYLSPIVSEAAGRVTTIAMAGASGLVAIVRGATQLWS